MLLKPVMPITTVKFDLSEVEIEDIERSIGKMIERDEEGNIIESCVNCHYFRNKVGMKNLGECFRYPPQILGDSQRNPNVSFTGWCGEWRRK